MTRRTVLILDDDLYIRKVVTSLLEDNGHEGIEARTGRIASAEMQKRQFDLVIVDFRLPDCDGLSWIAMQRNGGCTTPFLFLSGIFCDTVMATRLRNLFDGHLILQKPIDPVEFVRLVNVQLQQSCDSAEKSLDHLESSPEEVDIAADSGHLDNSLATIDGDLDIDLDEFASLEECISVDFDIWSQLDSVQPGTAATVHGQLGSESELPCDEDSSSFESVECTLDLLKWDYLRELPTVLRELANEVEWACLNNDEQALESVMLKIHTMKGSSGSLGLRAISQFAGTIESSLESRIEPPILVSILERIIATESPT